MPCSHQTPAGPEHQAIRRSRYCLPLVTQRRLPQVVNFGAQSHGLPLRCLRVAVTVTRAPRKTRFRLVANLYRAGFTTRWVPLQGFSNASTLLPPCPSFPGARGLKYEMFTVRRLTCTPPIHLSPKNGTYRRLYLPVPPINNQRTK